MTKIGKFNMLMPMIYLSILFLFISSIEASDHLPEERNYVASVDVGYKELYQTHSLLNSHQYVLTFDDGPHEIYTPQILDVLKKYDVKATFFIITSRLNSETNIIVKRMLDEGHIVANHGKTHARSNLLTEKAFKENIQAGFEELKQSYGPYPMETFYYRFPYADYGAPKSAYHHMNSIRELSYQMFQQNCIHFTFWDIDSGDWIPSLNSQEVFQNLKAEHLGGKAYTYEIRRTASGTTYPKKPITIDQPKSGGVILFHDIQAKTIKALDLFLQFSLQENISIVPLHQVQEFSYNYACHY
jgi:peptidoglycan/xylan/chitin deacetylase (PgdA/CDA1 family)